MANQLLDGPIPGSSPQDILRIIQKRAGMFDYQFTRSSGALANSDTVKKFWTAPHNGSVTAVEHVVARDASTAACTLSVTNITQSREILNAATVAVDGQTANAQNDMTLSATAANLNFQAGDVIEIAWVTDGSGVVVVDQDCTVFWTPND